MSGTFAKIAIETARGSESDGEFGRLQILHRVRFQFYYSHLMKIENIFRQSDLSQCKIIDFAEK